jgi:AraC-like DNA-binding protein
MRPSTAGQERIEYRKALDVPGLELMRVAHSAPRMWRFFHETYTICCLHRGRPADYVYRRGIHQFEAGGVALMEPGETHYNTKTTSQGTFTVLWIQPSVMQEVAKELGVAVPNPHLKVATLFDQELFHAASSVDECQIAAFTPLERGARFARLVRLVLERCAELSPPRHSASVGSAAVRRARDFLCDHLDDPVTLDDLVTASGAGSRFHLVRSFTAHLGMPPHLYQIHQRVTRARALLAAGLRPAEVAANLGFADQSHFTRHFRRISGITPGAYARAVAAPSPHASAPGR